MYMFSNIKRASQTTLHCNENFLAESLIEQVNNIRRHKPDSQLRLLADVGGRFPGSSLQVLRDAIQVHSDY